MADVPVKPNDSVQMSHAKWLAILDDVRQDPDLRAEALKRIASALILLETQAVSLTGLLEMGRVEVENLRAYQRRVINAAAPDGYAIVEESLLPLDKKPNGSTTLVPTLRVVRPEGR